MFNESEFKQKLYGVTLLQNFLFFKIYKNKKYLALNHFSKKVVNYKTIPFTFCSVHVVCSLMFVLRAVGLWCLYVPVGLMLCFVHSAWYLMQHHARRRCWARGRTRRCTRRRWVSWRRTWRPVPCCRGPKRWRCCTTCWALCLPTGKPKPLL